MVNLYSNNSLLSTLARAVVKVAEQCNSESYLVFGAEGKDFIIEICTGEMSHRFVQKTIYIAVGCINYYEVRDNLLYGAEVLLNLPDACHLIGLIRLLEVALKTKTYILHPLDDNGNFLADWENSMELITADEGL